MTLTMQRLYSKVNMWSAQGIVHEIQGIGHRASGIGQMKAVRVGYAALMVGEPIVPKGRKNLRQVSRSTVTVQRHTGRSSSTRAT